MEPFRAVSPHYSLAQIAMDWLFNQELQVIPLQGGENAQMYRQTMESAKIRLTPREIEWLDLRD